MEVINVVIWPKERSIPEQRPYCWWELSRRFASLD